MSFTQPPFPEWLDATAINDFRTCDVKGYWARMRRVKQKEYNIHLHAGAAFASGVEATRTAYYVDKVPETRAIAIGAATLIDAFGDVEVADKEVKTWDKMLEAFAVYWETFPLSSGKILPFILAGKPTIEFSFAVPLDILHPVTGSPILYCGRFDAMGEYRGLPIAIDEKTTQRLGATWASKWDLRAQFLGYAWAAQQYGVDIRGTMVRGIGLYKDRVECVEHYVSHDPWKIERWRKVTEATVHRMIETWKSGNYIHNLGDSCTQFYGCPFKRLCESEMPDAWVSTYYEPDDWNPAFVAHRDPPNIIFNAA